MNYLRSTLLFVSTLFLCIGAQAAAYDKPTVSSYVKNIDYKAPSESIKILLKSALKGVRDARIQYHACVGAQQKKRATRKDARIALLAARVHIPVEQLPSVMSARKLHESHVSDVALICNDAGLPFDSFEEYNKIVERICDASNILKEFSDDIDDDLETYEENFVQFIEFLIEICPDELRDLKQRLQQRIVHQEPESVQQPLCEEDFSLAASSELASLLDYSGERQAPSDDEFDAAEQIRREAAKSYQEAVTKMLQEQDEALRARELLYEREPVTS